MKTTKKGNTSQTDLSESQREMAEIYSKINSQTQRPKRLFRHSPVFNGRKFKKNDITYEIIGHFWDWFERDGEKVNLDSIRFTDGVTTFAMELQEFYTKVDI